MENLDECDSQSICHIGTNIEYDWRSVHDNVRSEHLNMELKFAVQSITTRNQQCTYLQCLQLRMHYTLKFDTTQKVR